MPTTELVVLRGGLAVPESVLIKVWQLEDRGLRFAVEDHELVVTPGASLDANDRAFLADHRRLVADLVIYCATTAVI